MKYRKLPVVIEAVIWDGKNFDEISHFTGDWHGHKKAHEDAEEGAIRTGCLYISTLEGDMKAAAGDYIIKGVNGEFYPCKPDIFQKTYQPAESLPSPAYGEVIAILKELVELKDMKTKSEYNSTPSSEKWDLKIEYEKRRPLAWQAARELLSILTTINKTGE